MERWRKKEGADRKEVERERNMVEVTEEESKEDTSVIVSLLVH